MRAKIFISALLLSAVITTANSQDKTSREFRKQKRMEEQKITEALIDAREFVFVPQTAIPSGMKSINLTSNLYHIKFQPEIIDSYLPFFGYGYNGIGYGTDTGMHFKGQPEEFKVEKNEKGYLINASIKGENDIFTLSLNIGLQGNASLVISSNKRSTISYYGRISSDKNK